VLIIADIHANLAALEAVFDDAGPIDEIWSLGDLVGYGPNPNEAIELLREFPVRSIAGNHDMGCIEKTDLRRFNADARTACEWTSRVLSHSARDYLMDLSTMGEFGDVTVAHGSPLDPIWEYLANAQVAKASFAHFATQACLVGHTHVPLIFRCCPGSGGAWEVVPEIPVSNTEIMSGSDRFILNPGSVGQPRDGDPRAAYACYEPTNGVFSFHRVAYDINVTQEGMHRVGLPDRLACRLQYGM